MNPNHIVPNNLSGLYAESKNCINRYDFQGAIEALKRAHKLDPTNDKIIVDLGSACAKAYDYATAQRWFDEALRVSPTPVPVCNAVGHAWLEVRTMRTSRSSAATSRPSSTPSSTTRPISCSAI